MAYSSDVAAGQTATAAQYNNLRKDAIDATDGHLHSGSTGNGRSLLVTITAAGTYATGNNYQALTDIFVHVLGAITSGTMTIKGFTDSSATPTTEVIGNATSLTRCGFMMAVKRGNYFRVEVSGTYSGGVSISTTAIGG